jgi:hypothetical protein
LATFASPVIQKARAGTGVVEGAVFALVGVLIAFSFSGAASRFDHRRDLIVQETNMIGTAYLRLDLLPADARADVQADFRHYVDARLNAYRPLPDTQAALAEVDSAAALQRGIWEKAVAAGQAAGAAPDAVKLLLPALNDMIEITTTRTLAAQLHPPLAIYLMLLGLDHNSDQVGHAPSSPIRHVGCGSRGTGGGPVQEGRLLAQSGQPLVAAERIVLTEP